MNALTGGNGGILKTEKLTGTKDGNLGANIETLAKAGYVAVEQGFRLAKESRRPR